MEATSTPVHVGRKISRIRELRGIKQEALAHELGLSQQTVSRLESNETVDEEMLVKIAKVLGVTPEVIKHFNEEAAINYFNNFNDHSFTNSSGTFGANNCTFNPLDKLMEAIEENKRLYERLLQSEREKIEMLMAIKKD